MSLSMEQAQVSVPKVKDRVVLIDGDILAYHCGFDNELTVDQCFDVAEGEVHNIMNFCRAEDYKIALTGKYKGGRYEIAERVPYQSGRVGKQKPVNIEPLKQKLHEQLGGVFTSEEADDLLVQWQVEAGCNDSTIIWSTDKDLKMCDGWHYDARGLTYVEGYGWCEYVKGKVKGFGKSFFFHQLLMGDKADTIPGIPTLFGKKCGAKRAFDYLEECEDEYSALIKVIDAYEDCFEETWLDELLEQGRLLWMRRVPYEDVLSYFKEVIGEQDQDERLEQIRLREVWEPDRK